MLGAWTTEMGCLSVPRHPLTETPNEKGLFFDLASILHSLAWLLGFCKVGGAFQSSPLTLLWAASNPAGPQDLVSGRVSLLRQNVPEVAGPGA